MADLLAVVADLGPLFAAAGMRRPRGRRVTEWTDRPLSCPEREACLMLREERRVGPGIVIVERF